MAQIRPLAAILLLVISTALVGVNAEFLVSSIDALVAQGGISETFVGLILLPSMFMILTIFGKLLKFIIVVGNAAEVKWELIVKI